MGKIVGRYNRGEHKCCQLAVAVSPRLFSFWGGRIDVLSNSDAEFDRSGPSNFAGSQIREVTRTDSPRLSGKMNIGGAGVGAYRGYRIPSLYPGVTWQQ